MDTGRVTRSGTIMYGKTTRSRIGKSGSTSGIWGSPCRFSSFAVTRITLSSRLFFVDECDRRRAHRPNAAETIGDHVPHFPRNDDRRGCRIGRAGEHAKPLAGRDPSTRFSVDSKPAHGEVGRPQRPPIFAVEADQPRRRGGPDRAVGPARDRVHELARQPFVFAPAAELPFL